VRSANGDFSQLFDDYVVENIITMSSDHYAVQVTLARDTPDRSSPIQRGFRFEAMWLRAPDYREAMERRPIL
jgi:hypothetical protein